MAGFPKSYDDVIKKCQVTNLNFYGNSLTMSEGLTKRWRS